jgi:hypothetical protein
MIRSIAVVAAMCLGLAAPLAAAEPDRTEATPPSPSFTNDVEPVLTRLGCNAGGCHGKNSGQNGFRLSLRGYAPELDHKWLTREFASRRLDFVAPERSLLLLKGTGSVPHGGGKLTEVGSRAYHVLRDWIASGAPGPSAEEPSITELRVDPAQQRMRPGETISLRVEASYSDGSKRDVTWLAGFDVNDASVAHVDADGHIASMRAGETAVRVSYQGHVQAVPLSIPFEHTVAADAFPPTSNFIDEHVFAKLATLRIPPSSVSSDAEFLRRAYVDTIGTLPTPDEVRAFLADSSPNKRAEWIDRLLERPEFVDYWTLQLDDLFQNRKERDHDVRTEAGVARFHDWLRDRVAQNTLWPQLTREVLTSSGANTDRPAVGYYIVTVGEARNPADAEVAASVAQSFLGTRIGCAKCHNHPLERFTQDDYYHFAAYFARVYLDRQKLEEGPTTLHVMPQSAGQTQSRIAKMQTELADLEQKGEPEALDRKFAEIEQHRERFLKEKDEVAKVRQPRTGQELFPQPLDRQPIEGELPSDPREALVDWMTRPENNEFWGSIVNRVWKHYMAVGLVEPVDDLRATNPPSNPELWRALIADFQASGGDLKHLMRRILNSRTYQLASTTRPENATDGRFYSHYYVRRLPAEVLMDAIAQATSVPDSFKDLPTGTRAIGLPGPTVQSDFLTTFGRSDRVTACACERSGEVTLPQLLNLQNGDNVLGKITHGEGRLQRLLKAETPTPEIIDQLFLATLGRMPSDEQRRIAEDMIGPEGNRQDGLEDLFWALVNSKEFSFNH